LTLQEYLFHILTTFRVNVESVNELMRFDTMVLEFALRHLNILQERLTKVEGFDNPQFHVEHTITRLRNVRINDSLGPHYQQMLNQCNVLLVSYFSSAVGETFRAGVADAIRTGTRPAILDEEIKIKFRGLRDIGSDLPERAGDLLAEHRDISFQNMHGVAKTFRDYFDYNRPQDEVFNDLLVAHACRHVTVHCAGIADRKMMGQIKSAKPRSLKPDIHLGQHIQFTEEEVAQVGFRMDNYLKDLCDVVASGQGDASPEPGTSGTGGT
jgi:hypothetical protein